MNKYNDNKTIGSKTPQLKQPKANLTDFFNANSNVPTSCMQNIVTQNFWLS